MHDTHFMGICVECFKDISYVVSLNSPREASRIDSEITQKLLDSEKLALVLDLDNTLLHTITEDSLTEIPENFISEHPECQDVLEIFLTPDSKKHYVKLRPGLFEFLEEAQKRFELYICTMGTKAYATSVARILDPTSTLFTFDKVISREDCPGSTKNLQMIFPCDNSMVLILDDREDVWTNSNNEVSPNLLRIEPYQFFSEAAQKQKKDSYLEKVTRVLRSIHKEFYTDPENNDVKVILEKHKKQIFGGCTFVFRGFHAPIIETATILAQKFGASVATELTDSVTHLISNKLASHRASQFLIEANVDVVSVEWLCDSIKSWKRKDETKYSLLSTSVEREAGEPNRRKRKQPDEE